MEKDLLVFTFPDTIGGEHMEKLADAIKAKLDDAYTVLLVDRCSGVTVIPRPQAPTGDDEVRP